MRIYFVGGGQISFGAILTPLGVGLLAYGFGAFFQLLPGTELSALMLIYGFPISLLGFALSYAQLKPVPCKTTRQALALRDTQATNIQKQVRYMLDVMAFDMVRLLHGGVHSQKRKLFLMYVSFCGKYV